MDILIYFAGIVIGITAFLYIYSTINSVKEKFPPHESTAAPEPEIKVDEGTIAFRKRPALPPGTRVCPMCGSALTKFEGLYATRIDMSNSSKIMIMGCRYCYRDDADAEKSAKL